MGSRNVDKSVQQHAESVTLQWGEIPPWMEQIGTRETLARNGIPAIRLGRWIGDEPVFVLRLFDNGVDDGSS